MTASPIAFDPSTYTRAPNITLKSGISLALALVALCPANASASIKKASKGLKAAADKGTEAFAERQRLLGVTVESTSAATDLEADTSWGAFRSRLVSYGELPLHIAPRAPRAREIVDQLFSSGGLGFLKEKYPEQRTAMASLLKRIKDEDLASDIDELAGPEFLKALRDVQPRYDAMVTAMLSKSSGQNTPNLLLHKGAIQTAIVDYATKICATVDRDESETVEAALAALVPIDNHRKNNAHSASDAEPDPVDPDPVEQKTVEPASPTPSPEKK